MGETTKIPDGVPLPRPWGGALRTNWRNREREQQRREAVHNATRRPGPPRCFYYGAITDREWFLARSGFRGSAYRPGDGTRAQKGWIAARGGHTLDGRTYFERPGVGGEG